MHDAVASVMCPDAPKEIRQQMNMLTAWVDASQVYGSNMKKADQLRLYHKGEYSVTAIVNWVRCGLWLRVFLLLLYLKAFRVTGIRLIDHYEDKTDISKLYQSNNRLKEEKIAYTCLRACVSVCVSVSE